jgi:hypothetical protein
MGISELRLVVMGLMLTSLAACGGGGGGGAGGTTTTSPNDADFLTTSPDVDDVGESQRFNLTGTGTANGQTEAISGSYTSTRKPNQQIGGEEVTVYDTVFVINIPSSGASVSSGNTSYGQLDGTFLFLRDTDGVECYPNSNYSEIPASVKIGESGVLGSATCSDGTTLSASYLVERSTRNSSWAAIVLYGTYSVPGQADIFEDLTFHHSQDGRVHAVEFVAGDGSNSFDLRS